MEIKFEHTVEPTDDPLRVRQWTQANHHDKAGPAEKAHSQHLSYRAGRRALRRRRLPFFNIARACRKQAGTKFPICPKRFYWVICA